jgi:transcriptional regulator with XRE-family HTH domain
MQANGRSSHFLGAKLRALRRDNHITLEDLSARCAQVDPRVAPSVSYLSMIESGQRNPSAPVLALLAGVFQRSPAWFVDEQATFTPSTRAARGGGAPRMPFQPSFLFSTDLLQAAIPELLAQTGTTGRQFAHLLIRSHQETSRNEYPELERAAERVGLRRFPLSVDDLMALATRHGLQIRWFERKPVLARDKDEEVRSVVRSFFEAPRVIHLNRALQSDPARLRFDLASHVGHMVLHGGDGLKSPHATGGEIGESPEGGSAPVLDERDVLLAWRDFECSFFAGALLCPRVPFRRFLTRERHRVEARGKVGLTASVMMRRMTKVSTYPHWHFFDAYTPRHLHAVYRGNGIPLPWGNMSRAPDPCPHWAVFRMFHRGHGTSSSQISVIRQNDAWQLYCCHTLRTRDMAGNPHVLSVGIDLGPALASNMGDAGGIAQAVGEACLQQGGEARIGKDAREAMSAVSTILGIAWIEDALAQPARIICPRSSRCARGACGPCGTATRRGQDITDVQQEILARPKARRKGGRRVSRAGP